MLGVMRGAVNVGAVFGRLRREVHSSVVQTDLSTEVHIITPLDDFFSKHRYCKSHIPFFSLDVNCRQDFYGRVAKYHLENEVGVATFFFFSRASRTMRTTVRISGRHLL